MARSDGYNTKTRQLILDYLINNRQHAVSASNILEHLEEQGASPNPTTVYRYLDKLAGEQRIMKYVADKGEKAVFQYVDEGRNPLLSVQYVQRLTGTSQHIYRSAAGCNLTLCRQCKCRSIDCKSDGGLRWKSAQLISAAFSIAVI